MTATGPDAPRRRTAIPPLPALAGLAAATLAIAYAAQHFGGLEPCQLCLYQRWPWWAVLVLGGAGLLPVADGRIRRAVAAVCGVILLAGAALAAFHMGVEQGWWPGLASCAGGDAPGSLAEMQRLMNTPTVRCDEPAWTLFGVSMAGYNAVLSLAAGLWALWMAAARTTGRRVDAAAKGAASRSTPND